MQRCPYLHEMKERLLSEHQQHQPPPQLVSARIINVTDSPPPSFRSTSSTERLHHDTTATNTPAHTASKPVVTFKDVGYQRVVMEPVGTVVRLNADGFSSHTSPAHQRTPLMTRDHDDDYHCVRQTSWRPKNAKTSLFIITSFIYAKLLVVVCIAYVISDVVTHNLPLYYYEGFFTYLYGMSILFLLYVFCFLLQESTCCSGGPENGAQDQPKKVKKPPPDKKADKKKKKEEEKKKKEEEKKKKEEDEKKKKEEKEKEKEKDKAKKDKKNVQREVFPRKMRDLVAQRAAGPRATQSPTYRRNSEDVPVPVLELAGDDSVMSSQDPATQKKEGQEAPPQAPPQPPTAPASQPPPQPTPPPATVQQEQSQRDVEAGIVEKKSVRKRKTTQNDSSHGSFFLRVGAIAFGLGTMIYNGLEFGSFFEVPFTSPCYQILRGVNPVLQMIFTFMQMYFIFMNSRLNIHRFKVVARFGLMHVVATNICVWIRTLVLEYLKEITAYHRKNQTTGDEGLLGESIKSHILRSSSGIHDVMHAQASDLPTATAAAAGAGAAAVGLLGASPAAQNIVARASTSTLTAATATTLKSFVTTARNITTTVPTTVRTTIRSTTMKAYPAWAALRTTLSSTAATTTMEPTTSPTTTTSTTTTTTTTTTPFPTTTPTTTPSTTTELTTTFLSTTPFRNWFNFDSISNNFNSEMVGEETSNQIIAEAPNSIISESDPNSLFSEASNTIYNNFTAILPQALTSSNDTDILPPGCGRINIMGTIVQDSAPYLFPFIIEYSLIGAAVIYVMWKHIGRNPSRYVTEEDLEHRLEVMLSRRAVAMAQAQQQGRVDCVGASKGLFFGLLLLVGSLICLILFFVLIRHPDLSLLAIYLADVSHCALMVLSIIAIIIGFIRSRHMKSAFRYRVQGLKFRTEEQSDLNDILLRVSAFGLFIYAVFSVIAGALNAFTHEPNLLVMITGLLSIAQVVLQLLFIADVSRRRVHLPEHDRSKPGRQVVTFLLICNVTMWIIYTFETQKVEANPVQLDFYGFLAWAIVQRVTLPLCIFHRFHSAVTLAEIWKTSYKARLE